MPVTLAQAKLTTQEELDRRLIDEFQKSSWLLDNITFADVASPIGGGAGFTYSYFRIVKPSKAAFREVNAEYEASEAELQPYTVDLKVFGGKFDIDRIIARSGGVVDHVNMQVEQKVKSVSALFNDTVINGNSSTDAKAFDGLDVALAGSDTEWNASGSTINLDTVTNIKANADDFLLMLHKAMGKLDGQPSAFLCNSDMKATLEYIAKYQGRYQEMQDNFGRYISSYNGVPIIDVGAVVDSNEPVIENGVDGTSLYIVRLGLDGFHAISRANAPLIEIWAPDFSTAGAVKSGEVEMVAAVALKSTRAAGVIRKVKVAAE